MKYGNRYTAIVRDVLRCMYAKHDTIWFSLFLERRAKITQSDLLDYKPSAVAHGNVIWGCRADRHVELSK